MTRAFAYLRVSSKKQTEGDGFPRQLDAITKHAAAHGIKIVKVFKEDASGTLAGSDREQWVEMMSQVVSGDVNTVLIERLDRLARDLMIQEHIIADLKQQGVKLVSTNPMEADLCKDDPSRKVIRQIMGAMAEYDKTMLVLKLRVARQRVKKATSFGMT